MSERKSTFISVLAWIAIVLSGFGSVISVLQNLMLYSMLQDGLQWSPELELPLVLQFLFRHMQLFFGGILVCLLVTLVSSVGLLKRKEWARKTFAFMMGISVIYVVAAGVLQFYVTATIPAFSEGMSYAEAAIVSVIRIGTAVFAIGATVLLAWIIKKLSSEEIRQEFVS